MGINGTALVKTTSNTVVEGVVEATNERGIKIGGAWVNVSKFKPVELPRVGTGVRLSVDGKGFIQSVDVLERGASNTPSTLPGERDRQIARLTVLKAAAHFAAARTDIKSSDVLRIADAWLQWVHAGLD